MDPINMIYPKDFVGSEISCRTVVAQEVPEGAVYLDCRRWAIRNFKSIPNATIVRSNRGVR